VAIINTYETNRLNNIYI